MKKILAFDCGGTNTRLALINERFKIEKVHITPTLVNDKDAWVNNLIKMIEEFPKDDVVGISLGIPGVCDHKNGIILDMPNVRIKNIEIVKILNNKFNIPVYIRNDAELGSLAEASNGAGKHYERVFFITISTGLGGAFCINKEIQDYVTEIGHTAIIYKGIKTEYEKLLSGINVVNLAKINNIHEIKKAREMFEGVRNKNKNALILFSEWMNLLNNFIDLIINSYHPDIICITGGVTKSKDVFFNLLKKSHKGTRIVECKTKELAGLYGAAAFGFNSIK